MFHGTHGRPVFSTELNVLQSGEGVPSHAEHCLHRPRYPSDESALAELEKLGIMTTPVTVVDGEKVVGYDINRLKTLLGL